jgi:hypothetical protein
MYVARFTANGTFLGGEHFVASALPQSLRYGPDGELVVTGRFIGELDLGGGLLTGITPDDFFVHRFSP